MQQHRSPQPASGRGYELEPGGWRSGARDLQLHRDRGMKTMLRWTLRFALLTGIAACTGDIGGSKGANGTSTGGTTSGAGPTGAGGGTGTGVGPTGMPPPSEFKPAPAGLR